MGLCQSVQVQLSVFPVQLSKMMQHSENDISFFVFFFFFCFISEKDVNVYRLI